MLGADTLTSLVLPSCASNYFQEASPPNDRQNASAWQRADMLPHDLLELRSRLSEELARVEDRLAA